MWMLTLDDCNTHLSQREIPDTKSPKRPPASQLPINPCLSGSNCFLPLPGQKKAFPVKTMFLKVMLQSVLLLFRGSPSTEGSDRSSPVRAVVSVKGKTR